jgi:hypothetical protein
VNLFGLKLIVLHVGTNDIWVKEADPLANDIVRLLFDVGSRHQCEVAYSAILPRPVDLALTEDFVCSVNNLVYTKASFLATQLGAVCIPVWKSYHPFKKDGNVLFDMFRENSQFTGKPDMLHLSKEGAGKLQECLQDKITQWYLRQGLPKPKQYGEYKEISRHTAHQ